MNAAEPRRAKGPLRIVQAVVPAFVAHLVPNLLTLAVAFFVLLKAGVVSIERLSAGTILLVLLVTVITSLITFAAGIYLSMMRLMTRMLGRIPEGRD
jgi:hypothetical protein